MNLPLDYSRQYERWHNDTPEHIAAMRSYYTDLLKAYLPKNKQANILEIGCGRGYCMQALQALGYTNITGLEIDESQFNSCIKKDLNVLLVNESITHCLANEVHYDMVLALDVIEHLPHEIQLKQCRAIASCLQEEGVFICTVPNSCSPIALKWLYDDFTHYSTFTPNSLDFLLYNAGLNVIEIYGQEFFQPGLPSKSYFSAYYLKKSFWTHTIRSLFFRWSRMTQRMKLIGELGWEEGKRIPLSLNLFCVATKKSL